MTNLLTIDKITFKTKILTTAAAILAAVVLPQIFHAVGVISGQGAALGETFLPMQLPVILAGLLAGPIVGIVVGVLSPLISFGFSGMPGAVILPFIIIELAGYGLAAGVLSKVKMMAFSKLLLIQIAGRMLRASAILFAVYGLESQVINAAGIWNFVIGGLPGILLQWCLFPLIMFWIESGKKYND
ncbi:MAG: ECF transporter S component [Ignavibacteriales bacterium]